MKIKKQGCIWALVILLILLMGCGKNKSNENAWEVILANPVSEGLEVKIVGENLLQNKKIKLKADSEEEKKYSVKTLTDGITDDESLRWSSENDWENSKHWLQIQFPQKTTVSAVKLFWERLNVCDYSLEISEDGKQWKEVFRRKENPKSKEDAIVLEKEVMTTFLRLYVHDVNKLEEDFSIYYQNVSLLEIQAFGPLKDSFLISGSCIPKGYDRILKMPQVPEGYGLEFLGAEHESLIDTNGNVADTIADTKTQVGFLLSYQGKTVELPAMCMTVPASEDGEVMETSKLAIKTENNNGVLDGSTVSFDLQELEQSYGIEPMEWLPYGGELIVDENTRIECRLLEETEKILGEEGFQLTIGGETNRILIEGKNRTALRWGEVTLESMLEKNEGTLPTGIMRDYPSYEVRGFGIDVGRRAIPLSFLYEIVETMSVEKMNTLLVHLNDNQIITQSGYDGTMEGARELSAGFRLESDIYNEDGLRLTSTDMYYTKEEFSKFVEDAKAFGVEVIPEIDTPGHSLAFVKVFPNLGVQNPETADLLDVSKKEVRELVKNIWKEYLISDDGEATFANCDTIHIGMDEYFGEAEEYISYLIELADDIKRMAPEKKLRMWGSLTGMECDYSRVSRDIEIQLWSTEWANPTEMYEAGFDLINSQNTGLYLVPGTGYDRLNMEYLTNNWEPNIFETQKDRWEIPVYSPQMLGACYMLWNDMVFHEGMYYSEEELFDRFEEPLGIISKKLWKY